MVKTCLACQKELPFSEFTKNSKEDGGLSSKCRSCWRAYRVEKGLQKPPGWSRKTSDMAEYQREWRAANPDKVREYEKRRDRPYDPERERGKYERKMRRLKGPDYVVGSPQNKRVGELLPEVIAKRSKARRALRRAVKMGKVQKFPCWTCGDEDVHGHHHDYDKPLDVVWLCNKHHRELHAMI